jgi:hypothetical protein
LLRLADQEKFEIFLTTDQQLKYQQNLTDRQIAIVVRPRRAGQQSKNTQGGLPQSSTQSRWEILLKLIFDDCHPANEKPKVAQVRFTILHDHASNFSSP